MQNNLNIIDLIEKKKNNKELSKNEINFFIDSLMEGNISDYQIGAFLMSVYFSGMTEDETVYLTDALIKSGDVVNIGIPSVDILTTGGVGDKATLILLPLLVAAGIPTFKLLGKGLGYTGGTIDKLESIPSFNTQISINDFVNQIKNNHFAVSSQIHSLTPANKILQSLKHETATYNSIPLIASSVIAKKISTGADNIIIDIKYGSGAFLKTTEDAEKLSKLIVNVGKKLNSSITTIITSMDEPLGRAIGNTLEVIEAIEFLKGNITSGDLADLTYEIGAIALLQMNRYESTEQAKEHLKSLITSGKALEGFKEIIKKQKGNTKVINHYDIFALPKYKVECISKEEGFVNRIDAYKIAYGCNLLGATRNKNSDEIDKSVGIFLNKKTGEMVKKDETIFTIYANKEQDIELAKEYCYDAYKITEYKNEPNKLVHKIIRNNENV